MLLWDTHTSIPSPPAWSSCRSTVAPGSLFSNPPASPSPPRAPAVDSNSTSSEKASLSGPGCLASLRWHPICPFLSLHPAVMSCALRSPCCDATVSSRRAGSHLHLLHLQSPVRCPAQVGEEEVVTEWMEESWEVIKAALQPRASRQQCPFPGRI